MYATKVHGLKNPRFFQAELSEDGQKLILQQVHVLPDDCFYPDGWFSNNLEVIGRVIAADDGPAWGYAFGAGVKNKDIAELLAAEGYDVEIRSV